MCRRTDESEGELGTASVPRLLAAYASLGSRACPTYHLPALRAYSHTMHCFHNEIMPNVPQGPLVSGTFSPSCLPSLISPAVPAVCARRVPPAEGPPLQRLRSASSLSDCLQSLGLLATSPGPSPTRCSLPGPWQSHCVPQPPCAA